ncbi:MAG TPA: DUF4189 domain-containing protein [Noviherbaspirillum sp.]|nr:DUF4189 domain-containing protein [Noviherbaspirillum sp.]
MRSLDVRLFAWMLLIGLAYCLWPATAWAQQYPCPGPGPGERMIGMTQGGQGIASVPLCVRDGPAPAPQAPVSSYAAIAWHPDAADVWVDGNYTGPNAAQQGALEMCNQVMGGGCTSTGEWSNSSMTVIRDRGGDFHNGWNGEGRAGRRQALAECSAKQLLPCEVFATIRSSTSRRSPGASVRKFYAASAWVDGTEGNDNKLYVESGYRSADSAIAAAIKSCSDATSRPCVNNTWTGNGFIQAYSVDAGDSATVETSAKRAQEAARLNCKKLKSTTCELQALFDSRKPGLFVHDFTKTKAK